MFGDSIRTELLLNWSCVKESLLRMILIWIILWTSQVARFLNQLSTKMIHLMCPLWPFPTRAVCELQSGLVVKQIAICWYPLGLMQFFFIYLTKSEHFELLNFFWATLWSFHPLRLTRNRFERKDNARPHDTTPPTNKGVISFSTPLHRKNRDQTTLKQTSTQPFKNTLI